ncbi:hypothetical protein B0H14DRAFT_3599867 [Mycena olivaceomarginata]|nr:hypothetical protein B0H14DRAFT_3599867 [Mycena olivaceomarginata]
MRGVKARPESSSARPALECLDRHALAAARGIDGWAGEERCAALPFSLSPHSPSPPPLLLCGFSAFCRHGLVVCFPHSASVPHVTSMQSSTLLMTPPYSSLSSPCAHPPAFSFLATDPVVDHRPPSRAREVRYLARIRASLGVRWCGRGAFQEQALLMHAEIGFPRIHALLGVPFGGVRRRALLSGLDYGARVARSRRTMHWGYWSLVILPHARTDGRVGVGGGGIGLDVGLAPSVGRRLRQRSTARVIETARDRVLPDVATWNPPPFFARTLPGVAGGGRRCLGLES